ncbi:hypothetical protein SO694_00057267 [Aureococcus anophagefferens]|uniref:Calmodulin n=1 Tax=Aureococcus anophagefferens TaxID=44056 RepID=A0ABR1FX20_AURAN
MAFFHRDGAGNWHPFSDAENALLERAHADGAPRCRLPTMGANPAGHRDFEVRFGANATSARMPAAPDTGMIQVNVENGNTRIVRRDAPAAPDPFGAAIQLTQDFASSSAMYGWMLRKKLSGWRRGAWQRRFYVLAPRSGALLYFTKGLHTREVQLCRSADPAAPQAKGTILLRNAMILPETVDDDRPHSFSIVVPGAEYHVSAHSAQLKEDWIKQLIKATWLGVAGAMSFSSAGDRRGGATLPLGTPSGAVRSRPCRPAASALGASGAASAAYAAMPPAAPPSYAAAPPPPVAAAPDPFASLPVPTSTRARAPPPAPAYARRPNPYAAPPDADAPPPDAPPPDAPPPDAPPQLPSPLPSKPSTEDIATAADESALDDKWDEIWDHFDMDGTGTLSYDEFVDEARGLRAFLANLELAGDRERVQNVADLVKAVLAACDLDGSGQINKAEFLAPRGLGDVIVENLGFFATGGGACGARRGAAQLGAGRGRRAANFDLTVRTNGGRAYSSRDLPPGTVTPDTTVGLLKDIVAQVHGEASVARVKLINRGIALRDDAASLRDAGVREGDTLMLPQQPSYGQSSYGQSSYGQSSYGQPPPSPYGQQAPSYQQPQQPSHGQSSHGQPSYGQPPPSPYGQQAPSYQQPSSYGAYGQQSSPYGARAPPPAFARQRAAPPPAPSPQGAAAAVPANAGPGSVMTVRAPTGQTVRITVPAGHYAGSSFEFAYDAGGRRPRALARRPRRPTGPAGAAAWRGAGSLMRVVVPANAGPGSTLTVNVPGKGPHRIVVPAGCAPGQSFQFRVQ